MITKTGSIFDVSLSQTIPPALERDERMAALVEALARMFGVHASMILDTVGIYYRVGELDERVLDMLAADLHADWYDYDAPIEEKRRVIQNNVAIHRTMGTAESLRLVVESIHGDSRIEEWFDYGGEPYHFRLTLYENDQESKADLERVLKAVRIYKPVRARLDGVSTVNEQATAVYTGTVMRGRFSSAALPQLA